MDEERLAIQTRKKIAAGAICKAFKGLTGGVAEGTADERERWTLQQIPRSDLGTEACTTQEDNKVAGRLAWGGGDTKKASKALREAAAINAPPGKLPVLPLTRLPALSAPGPSGDRQEHLDDILRSCGPAVRGRLMRALDELTVRWAAGTLPDACRWLLDTQLLLFREDTEGKNNDFDDEQWTLEELSWDADVQKQQR